jgi:hypothetical protein
VEMFKAICKLGLEGIVSKKLNAPYKPGHQRVAENQKPESTGCYTLNRGGAPEIWPEFDAREATFGWPSNNVKWFVGAQPL